MSSFLTKPTIVPYPFTLVLSILLGLHGHRSGSLSLSGAITASLLGYLTLANPLSIFGVALLTFYFSGSRATKYKAARKALLEEDEHAPSSPSPPSPTAPTATEGNKKQKKAGGNRLATQVACNALFGTLCAVTWRVLYSGEFADGKEWNGRIWNMFVEKGERWCVVEIKWGWSRCLVLGAVAFWGACAGDTFASEVRPVPLSTLSHVSLTSSLVSPIQQLGMLSSSPPRLLTTLHVVPPGTNGGVTPWGLLVSLLGGLLVGTTSAITLVLQNPECGTFPPSSSRIVGGPWWLEIVLVGGASGLIGSLIDSLLGATLQQTLYSLTRSQIVHSRTKKVDDEKIVNVKGSGWDLLSNNGVNAISATGTAGLIAWLVGGR